MILFILICFIITITKIYGWTNNNKYYLNTKNKKPMDITEKFIVNLDLPPEERWTKIAKSSYYQAKKPYLKDYLKSKIPSKMLPIIETIGKDIVGYYGEEYGNEMRGVAEGKNKIYIV